MFASFHSANKTNNNQRQQTEGWRENKEKERQRDCSQHNNTVGANDVILVGVEREARANEFLPPPWRCVLVVRVCVRRSGHACVQQNCVVRLRVQLAICFIGDREFRLKTFADSKATEAGK